MRPLLIVNPHSQGGKTGELAGELQAVIERYLGDVDRLDTERPRHAAEISETAAREGRALVIAVGGDGTMHEVCNGLMLARAEGIELPKLGMVGQGTGGDFRRTLGFEHRLDHYCKALAANVTRAIDVGKLSFRNRAGEQKHAYFMNVLSVGLGGLVDQLVAESRAPGSGSLRALLGNSVGGTAAYLGASIRALLQSEIGRLGCTIHLGDKVRQIDIKTRQIAICNGRYHGGGMEIAPMATPDDGIFDVVSLGAAPRFKFALASAAVYRGKHVDAPGVEVFRCDRIEIRLRNQAIRDRFLLDVDGEPLGTLPIDIEVVPGALEILVP